MNVLIVEDELLAADRLEKMIGLTNHEVTIVDRVDTVREAVSYLKESKETIDLLFCDIQLADGISFDIFDQVNVERPVIFTTAYDEYSIQAFQVNSVDYLLKPINSDDVQRAIDKYAKYYTQTNTPNLKELKTLFQQAAPKPSRRFLVKSGIKMIPKKMDQFGLIYTEDRLVYFVDRADQKTYLIDFTLDELINKELDQNQFFRVNRKQIINIEAIDVIRPHLNQRLSLSLNIPTRQEVIVSREKVNDFKKWFIK